MLKAVGLGKFLAGRYSMEEFEISFGNWSVLTSSIGRRLVGPETGSSDP